jgi:hypothetical protein
MKPPYDAVRNIPETALAYEFHPAIRRKIKQRMRS